MKNYFLVKIKNKVMGTLLVASALGVGISAEPASALLIVGIFLDIRLVMVDLLFVPKGMLSLNQVNQVQ